MKKQNRLLVASLLAVPAAIAVAGSAQAAETTLPMFEVHNDFVNASSAATVESTVQATAPTKADLEAEIIKQLKEYTKGFTITYGAGTKDNYKQDVEEVFATIKANLNTVSGATDYTMLYGTFNNLRVEATEVKDANGTVTGVKLKFSVKYFMDKSAETALTSLVASLTSGGNAIFPTGSNDVQKLKAVHDYAVKNFYVVPSDNNLSTLVLNKRGSSHAYALFMYKLLNAANISGLEAKYVAGRVDGEAHSWNVVKLGGKHYHFDAASDDTIVSGDKKVSYQYFLAGDDPTSNRHIYYGMTSPTWGTAYSDFANIVNPAEAGDKLYYADEEYGGTLSVLNLGNVSPTATALPLTGNTEATSSHGGVAYYTYTSADTVTVYEDLYFINNSIGNYLYKYNLQNNEEVLLVDKTPIRNIEGVSGSFLVYYTTANVRKTLDLNDITSFNLETAQEVINLIDSISTVSGDAKKNKVIEARNKYNTLTAGQQALVTNKQLLIDAEQALIAASAGTLVRSTIAGINALDPLKSTFYDDVKALVANYNNFSPANRALVYNYSILAEAKLLIDEVENLQVVIGEFVVNGNTPPFETISNALEVFDSITARYNALLPSLKTKIDPAHASYLTSYKGIAEQLKLDVIGLENEIEKINASSADYLTKMQTLQVTYNNFFNSQKAIMKPVYKRSIEQHIAATATLLAEVTALDTLVSEIMGTATTVDSVTITPDVIAKVVQAENKFNTMSMAQKNELNVATKNNLVALRQKINGITTRPEVVNVVTIINGLNYIDFNGTAAGLADFKSKVTSADAAYVALSNELKAGVPSAVLTKLRDYEAAIVAAEAVLSEINALTNTSPKAAVQAVRARYNALSEVGKHFVTEIQNLIDQEERLKLIDDEETAAYVIALIEALTEESSLQQINVAKQAFDNLSAEAKAKVPQASIDKLNRLYAAKQDEIDELIRQARAVEAMIDRLTEESTAEQVLAVRAAYEALDPYAKAYVSPEKLAKLKDLEFLLEDQIIIEQALQLDNEILSISESTSLERVLEIYEKYQNASDEVKNLLNEIELLEYWYNKKITENEALIEQAKKDGKLVYDRIEKISPEHTEAHIRAIRAAYEELSDLAKTFVTNLEKLEKAEANIVYENTIGKEARAEAAAFDSFMEKLSRKSEKDEIRDARRHYNRLSEAAKKYVTTYNKLKRLEEMFSDKDYEDLFENYYPHYVDEPKPGGVEPEEITYDPLYIQDDSTQYFAYTEYEENKSTLLSGGFIKIDPAQLKHSTSKTITFTAADNVEITLPVAELKNAKGTIGVTLKTDNSEVIVTFTENNRLKTFTDNVTIKVPFDVLDATASMKVESTSYSGVKGQAVYKLSGTNFVISTKQSGTFTAQSADTNYRDIGSLKASTATAIKELTKRGITSGAVYNQYEPNKTIKRKDIAIMVTQALNLSTTTTPRYTDVRSSSGAMESQAVLEAGIMKGISSTQFKPFNEITREEGAIIIANLLRHQELPIAVANTQQTTSYKDAKSMSYEAQHSVAILELAGILNGEGNFNPKANMKRSEFAELLYKALQKVNAL